MPTDLPTLPQTRAFLNRKLKMLIGEQWLDAASGDTMNFRNPATGEVLGDVPAAGKEDVNRAVQAARQAFPAWARRTLEERISVLEAFAASLIASLDVKAEPGSIYAVYEDAGLGTQHIALRCPASLGRTAKGAFVELTAEGVADVTDPALRQMLQRLAEESRMGNYGIYFGTHEQGRVQRIAEGQN